MDRPSVMRPGLRLKVFSTPGYLAAGSKHGRTPGFPWRRDTQNGIRRQRKIGRLEDSLQTAFLLGRSKCRNGRRQFHVSAAIATPVIAAVASVPFSFKSTNAMWPVQRVVEVELLGHLELLRRRLAGNAIVPRRSESSASSHPSHVH